MLLIIEILPKILQVMVLLMTLSLVSPIPSARTKTSLKPRLKPYFSSFNEPLNNHFGDPLFDTQQAHFGSSSTDKSDAVPSAYKSADAHDSFRYNNGNSHFGNSASGLGSSANHYGPPLTQYNGILTPYSSPMKGFDAPFDTTTLLEHDLTTGPASKFDLSSGELGLHCYSDISNDFSNIQSKLQHSGFGGSSDFSKSIHHEEPPAKDMDPGLGRFNLISGPNEDIGSYWTGHKSHPKFGQKKLEDDPLYQDYAGDFHNLGSQKNNLIASKYSSRVDSKPNLDYIGDEFSNGRNDYDKGLRGSHVSRLNGRRGFFGRKNIGSNVAMYPLFKK